MEHTEVWELLGAWALNACDDEELSAIDSHLLVCVKCAQTAARLSELVDSFILRSEGRVDGLDLAGIDPATVEALRARVLDGAHRPPSGFLAMWRGCDPT